MNNEEQKTEEKTPGQSPVSFAIAGLDKLKRLIPPETKINLASMAKFLAERKERLKK